MEKQKKGALGICAKIVEERECSSQKSGIVKRHKH